MKITIFTAVKYCSLLHGHVCVMTDLCLVWIALLRILAFVIPDILECLCHAAAVTSFIPCENESTVKPVLSGHSKIDKMKVLKTGGSLMQVKSIAECPGEHSAILFTCIKWLSVMEILSFEWPFKTGLTVLTNEWTKLRNEEWIYKRRWKRRKKPEWMNECITFKGDFKWDWNIKQQPWISSFSDFIDDFTLSK